MNRRTFLGNILTLAGTAIFKPSPLIFDMGKNSSIYTPKLGFVDHSSTIELLKYFTFKYEKTTHYVVISDCIICA